MKQRPRANSTWPVLILALALAGAAASAATSSADAPPAPGEAEVREAALVVYFHGITEEIALETVGPQGAQHLVMLLREPGFPRRDNVVALLAFLGNDAIVPDLIRVLESPAGPPGVPEENRAMLLVPQALGHLAARGSRRAAEALLSMTAHHGDGGPLSAPTRSGRVHPARDDLIEAAIRGLAFSGKPDAIDRLIEISEGRVRPAPGGRDPRVAARTALELVPEADGSRLADFETSRAVSAGASRGLEPDPPAVAPVIVEDIDVQSVVRDSRLTTANHTDLAWPITSTRLYWVLREASLRVGRDDYDLDIACCITAGQEGQPRSFGEAGDELNVIDNRREMLEVLEEPVARVKLVEAINWCGDPAMNIIGCSYKPGYGMALVRMSDVVFEGILWIHEYGHNVGLGHTGDARDIMHGTNNGDNRGMDQAECNAFHFPPDDAAMVPRVTGFCADFDDDSVHDLADNCEGVANTSQLDSNMDGVGDVCQLEDTDGDGAPDGSDNCPTDPNAGQEDLDLDGRGDLCDPDDDDDGLFDGDDNCPLTANPDQIDSDGDGLGDACDGCRDLDGDGYGSPGHAECAAGAAEDCDDRRREIRPGAPELCDGLDNDCDLEQDEALCEDFDINGDDAVDGLEVAWLARAFGLCSGPPAWWSPVDYTNDGCVDGEDLAFLASVWNCSGRGLVCE